MMQEAPGAGSKSVKVIPFKRLQERELEKSP